MFIKNALAYPSSFLLVILFPFFTQAQHKLPVLIQKDGRHQRVQISIAGKPFTSLLYADSMYKPVLFPIYAADDVLITRGFPIATRPGEPTDHPHHIGLWLNYENVNGLDFWNNSSAISPDKKAAYGRIRTSAILEIKTGKNNRLSYSARWQDIHGNDFINEITSFHFTAYRQLRIIDRNTTLTALQDLTMPDAKDGLLGLRVAHELELPSIEQRTYTDQHGNTTTINPGNEYVPTGNYINSRGQRGDSVWGTRAEWCMLYGKKGSDSISIVIIDHPKNIGYPTYWHARGYGLFAANPLGQKVFSNGSAILNFSLVKGNAVSFRYRILIYSGKDRLKAAVIESFVKEFTDE